MEEQGKDLGQSLSVSRNFFPPSSSALGENVQCPLRIGSRIFHSSEGVPQILFIGPEGDTELVQATLRSALFGDVYPILQRAQPLVKGFLRGNFASL